MSAYTTAVLADSPVSYWRLDETSGTNAVDQQAANAGTYSATVGGGTGVSSAASLLVRDADTAIAFASSKLVDFGNPVGFQLSTGTIECWVKTSQAPDAAYHAIMAKSNAVWAGLITGTGTLGVFDWGTSTPRDSGVSISDGKSHHVVVTFQSGVTNGTIIYLDGQSVLTTTVTFTGQSNSLRVASDFSSQALTCTADEPAIYSTVLSAARVLVHFQAATLNATASDAVTVTDTPVLKGGAQPVLSQSVTVSDTPVLKGGAQPVISESLTVTDTPVVKGPAQPQASEALAVSESAAVVVVIATSQSEAVTVTEAVTVQGPSQPNVSEALTVTDSPVVQGSAQPKPSEAVTVSETVAVQVLVAASTSQAITLTDTPAVFLPVLTQAAAESITVTDTPVLKGGAQPVVSDAVTVSETTVTELVSFIAASQAITVSEAVAALLAYRTVSVSETVTVTDTAAAQIATGAALTINASETLSVTETLTPILPYLTLAAADTLTATDTQAVQAIIRVAASEQITVSTTVRLPINYIDAQSGTLTFTGSATSSIGPDLNVTWKRQHLYYVDYRNWVRGP